MLPLRRNRHPGGQFQADRTHHASALRHPRGYYTAAIRCVIDHKVIFFIVAGPSLEQAPKYLDDIYGHF